MSGEGGSTHLLGVHLDLVVGGGDDDVLGGEVADIHCELIRVAQGLHRPGVARSSCWRWGGHSRSLGLPKNAFWGHSHILVGTPRKTGSAQDGEVLVCGEEAALKNAVNPP